MTCEVHAMLATRRTQFVCFHVCSTACMTLGVQHSMHGRCMCAGWRAAHGVREGGGGSEHLSHGMTLCSACVMMFGYGCAPHDVRSHVNAPLGMPHGIMTCL